MSRPTLDEVFIAMAFVLASRGTCGRRKVGCVIVDYNNHVLSTGYNGSPKWAPHCIDKPCKGMSSPSGSGLDLCDAIHAEENALLQCRNTQDIAKIYTTTFPCIHCFKLICNTSCTEVIYHDEYAAHQNLVEELNSKMQHPIKFRRLLNATGPLHAATELEFYQSGGLAGPVSS